MRKTTAFLLLLISFSCKQPKPEGFKLNVQFQPEKTYRISTIRGTETVITYSGEGFAMKKLKSMKVQNPTISSVRTKTDTELETGKDLAGTGFPVKLTYIRTMSLDGKNQLPEGTAVHGEISESHLPVFSQVISESIDFDQKEQLLQTINATFEQFKFPENSLKIGDEFSIDRPTVIRMEQSDIETIVTTNYKLTGIENGVAVFELSQMYKMTPQTLDNSFVGEGHGKGKMLYDVNNQIISDYSIKTEITMNKKLDYFEFDLKTTSEFTQSTSLVTK
jgi:hypothetical protein